MKEKRFKKGLNNSESNSSSNRSSAHSLNLNTDETKATVTKKRNYFDIYNQIKEEIKKNSNESNKANTAITQTNDNSKKRYNTAIIQGTKDLKGINKKYPSKKTKNNSNPFIEKMPLKNRNHESNKNSKKVESISIPIKDNKDTINKYENEEFDKTEEKTIFKRKMENTYQLPPNAKIEFCKIKKAKLIQKWYRFIKGKRITFNKKISKLKTLNVTEKNKTSKNPLYYPKKEISFKLIQNNENNSNKFPKEFNNKATTKLKLNNHYYNHKDNLPQVTKYLNNSIDKGYESFQIINENNSKNLEEINSIIKPINNNCYITKGEMNLLNNSEDMSNLNLIQKKVKQYLRNKNKISPYTIYKQMEQKKLDDKDNLSPISNSFFERELNINNNSENVLEKKRIISKLDSLNSLQSFHNLTIQEKESVDYDKILNDNNEKIKQGNNSLNYDNINESDNNLLNFSFNSGKIKSKKKISNNDNPKLIQKKKSYTKYFFISKYIYSDFNDLICRIKFLQNYIRKFLYKNKNHKYIYSETSSEYKEQNNYIIENDYFNLHSKKKSEKEKILKMLVNKYNKKLNKEVDNNMGIYYESNAQKKEIIKISKSKLAIDSVNIIKNNFRIIFNNIYQYKSINYRRKDSLLKIINNINSKLRRYFFRWSNKPMKLLIYKSKSVKYYNSLFTLKNNIRLLIKSIYNTFVSKYYYMLIIYYLKMNNIDIMNSKIFLMLNNKQKLKTFIEISKTINIKKNNNALNKLNIVEYFKEFEKLDNGFDLNHEEEIED